MKTYLPLFSGFYNTMWANDMDTQQEQIIENIREERLEKKIFSDFDIDDINIDYKAYEKDLAINICQSVHEHLKDYIISVTFESLYSPKFYNFSNDSINADIVPNIENIRNYILQNKNDFIEYLKKHYKSCDGFCSHYSYDFDVWQNDTNDFNDYSINEHYLGSILNFIALNIGIDEYTILCEVVDCIQLDNYVINYDEIVNQFDNSLYEYLIYKRYDNKHAEYINRSFENGLIDTICFNETIKSDIKEYQENLANMN